MNGEARPQRDIIPTPDPTVLSTALIQREVEGLKELLSTRLDGMDEAIKVAKADLVRVPTDVDKQVGNLKDLHGERFRGVDARFSERDIRFEQAARDTKAAVEAALQSAERAVSKQNETTAKQIDALLMTLTTASVSLDGKIQDLKERMARMESLGIGRANAVGEGRAAANEMRAYLSLGVSLIIVAIAILGLVLGKH